MWGGRGFPCAGVSHPNSPEGPPGAAESGRLRCLEEAVQAGAGGLPSLASTCDLERVTPN